MCTARLFVVCFQHRSTNLLRISVKCVMPERGPDDS